jgi:hypothetical protein
MTTLDQSIVIYARASRSWWWHNAAAQARRKAGECRKRSDVTGTDVWQRVEAEISRLDAARVPYRLPR